MSDVLRQAEERRLRALALLGSLRYLERWSALGHTELVGSVRHGLVVARDVDVEVTVPELDVAASFAVVAGIAPDPGRRTGALPQPVRRARVALLGVRRPRRAEDPDYRALDIYRAVVDGHARTVEEFAAWRVQNGSPDLVRWIPG